VEDKIKPEWGKTGKCQLSEFSYPYPNSYSYLPEREKRKGRDGEGEEFNTRAPRHKGKIRLRFGKESEGTGSYQLIDFFCRPQKKNGGCSPLL